MNDLLKQIEQAILTDLPDAQVIVRDPMNDGAHFDAMVISESFVGMPLVKQHRQVMQSLKRLLADQVHALSLKTYTPDQWADANESPQA